MGNDNPPKLLEGYEFLQWKREIEMWALATSLDAKKQGPAVVISIIDRKAREYATRLDKAKLVCRRWYWSDLSVD